MQQSKEAGNFGRHNMDWALEVSAVVNIYAFKQEFTKCFTYIKCINLNNDSKIVSRKKHYYYYYDLHL